MVPRDLRRRRQGKQWFERLKRRNEFKRPKVRQGKRKSKGSGIWEKFREAK